ncbi:uncharacterized protein LOC113315394 [Papaver somniferum]|uniref:uncharacterized protein LOC113315394 n=1 Tax=Papaver somniferum TaxID=3469 RepID=UPI000E6F49D3|nr:uncharacterized protein LOC113315394 [Papaver somniferum]
MKTRLTRWKGKFVNQVGRSVLISSVLNTMPSNHMGIFKIPDATIKEVNNVQLQFWWNKYDGKGLELIGWPNVCKHKHEGGMGFKDLKCLALLVKAAWRLIQHEKQLWAKSMKEKYFPNTSALHAKKKKNSTWAWQSIHSSMDFLRQFSFRVVGDGSRVCTWLDNWIPGRQSPPIPAADIQIVEQYNHVSELIDQKTKT